MNPTVRLVLYVVLTLALAILGYGLVSALSGPGSGSTSALSPTNNATGALSGTNDAAAAAAAANAAANDDSDITVRRSSRNLGRATGYGVAMFFVFIGLAILIARDVSRYIGSRAQDFIFNDNLEGMKDPEYEEAEKVWAKGDYLESVRLMRAYLNKHPREQYVALRIAEIYETNLRNYLAAALEYEEVLKKKLPAERWGWAAIHLANLYSGKLDKVEEATKLLRRIVDDYGKTAAAKKARERLGIPEPVEPTETSEPARASAPAPVVVSIVGAPKAAVAAEPEPEPEPEPVSPPPPSHNLPKGFRPKS